MGNQCPAPQTLIIKGSNSARSRLTAKESGYLVAVQGQKPLYPLTVGTREPSDQLESCCLLSTTGQQSDFHGVTPAREPRDHSDVGTRLSGEMGRSGPGRCLPSEQAKHVAVGFSGDWVVTTPVIDRALGWDWWKGRLGSPYPGCFPPLHDGSLFCLWPLGHAALTLNAVVLTPVTGLKSSDTLRAVIWTSC